MNVNKKWLKDENNNYIAPKTLTSAVQDAGGRY